jgi:hypothetical protein
VTSRADTNPRTHVPLRSGRPVAASAAASALLCLTALVFAPAQIFYGNYMEFPIAFGDVLPTLVGLALAAAVALAALVIALPSPGARGVGVAVLVAVAVLVWTQSTFLLWPYGVLDGRDIDWQAHRWHGAIDAAVWCSVLAVVLAARRHVLRYAATLCVALIIVQGGAVVVQAMRTPQRWIDDTSFDESGRFAFSRQTNAVVVVLDTFQSDLFQELLDEDPSLAGMFRGFTYFRNATAGFSGTPASIPLILTGRYYDNAVPFQDYVRSAFRSGSLPKVLKDAGFHVYYNHPGFWFSLYADPSIASHAVTKTSWERQGSWAAASHLMKLGLFRSAPQAAKRRMKGVQAAYLPPVAADGLPAHLSPAVRNTPAGRKALAAIPWRAGDAPFFREAALLARASLDQPAFKYYHLMGVHPPLTHDEQLRASSPPFTRDNAKRQAVGLMRLLGTFFGTLSNLGVYDRTLLLIVGDHGASFEPRLVDVDNRLRGRPGTTPSATSNAFGLPLVLAKPIGADHPLRISDAPVALADVPRTVAASLGVTTDLPGHSMFDAVEDPLRRRRVMKYPSGAHRLAHGYFPALTEYEVSGFSWLDESWRPTGRRFLPGTMRAATQAETYHWGRWLRFNADGGGAAFLGEGWAAPEADFTWTVGRSARLRLRTAAATGDVVFRAEVVPAIVGPVRRQRVELFVGGTRVGEWSVTSAGEQTAIIPRALVPGGDLELILVLQDAVVPRDVNPALRDERELALAMTKAILDEAPGQDKP